MLSPTDLVSDREWEVEVPCSPMPTLAPAELSEWMVDRQADLQEAMSAGDDVRVLTLTSKLSDAAKHMCELTGSAS